MERRHSLAAKVATVVAGAAAAMGAGLVLAAALWPPGASAWWLLPAGVLGTAGLGAVAYATVQRLAHRRLAATRTLLRHLRRLEFEALEEQDAALRKTAEARDREGAAPDELDALLDETSRTARALTEKVRELRKMENYRREFIGNVSHELKTPIFSVRGFAETLLDGALDDPRVRRSFVEKIMRNADRLRHLARDLAEIARIETGELKMTVTAFPLRPLVAEVVESMEPAAEEKGVQISEHIPDGLPRVKGDRERLRQVLANLMDNAVKYNAPGGSVEVSARLAPSGGVTTYVVDDGVGVAPEHIERLTERFYRVDQSRSRNQGGTGLGLAIVKHILGAHGSELTVSSNPDHGSTFGFTLPAVSSAEEEQERREPNAAGKAIGETAGSAHRTAEEPAAEQASQVEKAAP